MTLLTTCINTRSMMLLYTNRPPPHSHKKVKTIHKDIFVTRRKIIIELMTKSLEIFVL